MTEPRRLARLFLLLPAFAALLLCTPAPARQSATTPAGEKRVFHLTVTDSKGRLVLGVRRESVTAFDGGEPSEIVSFGAPDAPASIMFLVDTSSSAFGLGKDSPRLAILKSALPVFLELGNPSNEYFVTAFNQKPQILLEGSRDASAVLAAFDRLAGADLSGQTALNDALYLSLNKLALHPARKRVLVLFSDGQENESKYSSADVMRALKESDVIVYAVGLDLPGDDASFSYQGHLFMGGLAAETGGLAVFPQSVAAMKGSLAQIAYELRNQYEVSFAPSARAKGDGWHAVKFKLAAEPRDARGRKVKATLRARKGFYDAGAPRKR